MPATTSEVDVPAILLGTAALNAELTKLSSSLFQREALMTLASDAVVVADLTDAIGLLFTSVTQIKDRLSEVGRLAVTIDRIADPQVMEQTR